MPIQLPSSLLGGKYGLTVKPDPSDWLAIEIGDTKQPDTFYPQVKAMRWDNEVNLSFRLVDSAPALPATVVQDGNVVEWQKTGIEAHFYDCGDSPDHPEGAFELEVLLKEKPASNVVGFTLQTKGLDFFYQPALTQAEIDAGCVRPENVVGSYAVYHSTQKGDYSQLGGNNYRAGKVCHIFRPQVTDANGASTWADLNIDTVALTATITIPQAFLNTAVYPVLVDPTFGWTTGGASNQSGNSGYAYTSGDTASPSSSGAVQSMSAYVWEGSGSVRVSLAVYNGVTLVDYTDQYTISVSNGSPPQWYQGVVVNKASVSQGTGYYLAWKGENYSLQMMYDTVGTNYVMWHVDAYYDPWGNPEYFTQWGSAYRQYSIYATYAPPSITGSGSLHSTGGKAAGSGTEKFSGSGTLNTPLQSVSGTASQTFSGSGALLNAGGATCDACSQVFSGAGTSSSTTASAGAASETFLGVGATGSSAGACSGIGSIADIVGSGACATHVACFGSGTYTPLAVLGSGACANPYVAAGTGTETFAGSGLGEKSPASHGTGVETFAGLGAGSNAQGSVGRAFAVGRVYQWPKRVFA